MGRKGIKALQFESNRQEMFYLEHEAAICEGRVEGLLGRDVFDAIEMTLNDGEYVGPDYRLDFWQRMEHIASSAANGDDLVVSTLRAVEKGKLGVEEGATRIKGLMMLQLAGWATGEV